MKKTARLFVLLVFVLMLLTAASAESALKVEQAPVQGCINTATISWIDVEAENAVGYRLYVTPGDQAVTIGTSGAAGCKTFTPKETANTYTVTLQYEKTEYNEETEQNVSAWYDYAAATVVVEAGGHAVELVEGQKATCTEDGWKDYCVCTRCKLYFEDAAGTKVIDDLEAWKLDAGKIAAPEGGHDWTSWYPERSQAEEDMFERYCRVCKVYEYRFFWPKYAIAKLLKNDAAAPQQLMAQHEEYTVFNGFYQVSKETNTSVPDQYLSFKLRDKQVKMAEEGKKIVGLYIDANNEIYEVEVKWQPDVTGQNEQHWIIHYQGKGIYCLAERAE